MNIIDGHCHILPCIDDGSNSLNNSVKMLNEAKKHGINHIVCTPHYKHQYNDIDKDLYMYKQLLPYANNYHVKLAMGWEVHWKKLLKIGFDNAKYLRLGNSNLFLLEFSYDNCPVNWESLVYNLQCQGLSVVIAHPERYAFVIDDFSMIESFVNAGCLIMTSGTFLDKSFLGRGKKINKVVKKMLKGGFIDIIASDAHSIQGYDLFSKSLNYATKHGYNISKSNSLLHEVF